MTLREHVGHVLSPLNRHGTRQTLGLDREPTEDELVDHYQKHVTIMTIAEFEVMRVEDPNQLTLFQEVTPKCGCPECGSSTTCPHYH